MPPKWPLPEKGDEIPQNTLTLEHADYTAAKDDWGFYRDSDELTGGYKASVDTYTTVSAVPAIETTYLIPHEKEDTISFPRRVASARPPRFVKEGIESLTGVLTEQEPNREKYPDKLKEWTNGVKPDGTTLQQLIASDLWPKVERYGVMYSYARRPSIGAANLAEQEQKIKDAGLPDVLLHLISPENLPWWSLDELGQFEIVRYIEVIDDPKMEGNYPVQNETYTRHWWITHEGWWYCNDDKTGDGVTVEEVGTWNTDGTALKNFPISPWEVKDRIPPTAAAALAQLAYFRKDSELDTVEKNAAFPQTWVPTTAGDEDPEETVKGPHPVAGWDPEGTGGAKPMILETTGVSLTHLAEKRLPALEQAALAPYGRQQEVGGNDSGVAIAQIQESSKRLFQQHAKHGGQSEFAALQVVAELLGEELTDEQRAPWPKKFGMLADASIGELLTSMAELEPGDPYMEQILRKFDKLLFELTPEESDEAIEAWKTERKEQKQIEKDQEAAMFGQDGALKEAQAEKVGAETEAIKKPFAAKPASAGKPAKKAP